VSLPENSDTIWQRAEIDSPCVKLCVVHPEARLCVGCHRTIAEISAWSRMTAGERQAVTADLPSRASQLAHRRGGRAARLSR
jgi:uncharacterized protein